MKETEVLLVGFGFSAIPLLRELDLSGVDYTILSEPDGSIWASLTRSGRLDFDLVSSYYTSFYTFDLVEDFSEDLRVSTLADGDARTLFEGRGRVGGSFPISASRHG